MSEEKCPKCKKSSEYPVDWYYNEGTGFVEYRCPYCGWKEGTHYRKRNKASYLWRRI